MDAFTFLASWPFHSSTGALVLDCQPTSFHSLLTALPKLIHSKYQKHGLHGLYFPGAPLTMTSYFSKPILKKHLSSRLHSLQSISSHKSSVFITEHFTNCVVDAAISSVFMNFAALSQKHSTSNAMKLLVSSPTQISRLIPELTMAAYIMSSLGKYGLKGRLLGQVAASPFSFCAIRKCQQDRYDDFIDVMQEAVINEGPLSLLKGASAGVCTVLVSHFLQQNMSKLFGKKLRK
ncbi:hypothetical protein RCL1_003670 [Eukaryota sp. TZLM3-RCL]